MIDCFYVYRCKGSIVPYAHKYTYAIAQQMAFSLELNHVEEVFLCRFHAIDYVFICLGNWSVVNSHCMANYAKVSIISCLLERGISFSMI